MGFVVEYKYHQATAPGEYNREETLTSDIKVGSPYEEIGLEVLAGRLMALMARRNIMVVGVEAFEIIKKPLVFKETDEGIILKNKKFKFDDGPAIAASEQWEETGGPVVEAPVAPAPPMDQNALLTQLLLNLTSGQLQLPQQRPALQPGQQPHEVVYHQPQQLPAQPQPQPQNQIVRAPGHIVKHEIFNPLMDYLLPQDKAKLPNLKLTKGKSYAILNEKKAGPSPLHGMLYTTVDDSGTQITLSDKFFTVQPKLVSDGMVASQAGLTETNLRWDSVVGDDVPDLNAIRGRR
jgi:hypothetical protein